MKPSQNSYKKIYKKDTFDHLTHHRPLHSSSFQRKIQTTYDHVKITGILTNGQSKAHIHYPDKKNYSIKSRMQNTSPNSTCVMATIMYASKKGTNGKQHSRHQRAYSNPQLCSLAYAIHRRHSRNSWMTSFEWQ